MEAGEVIGKAIAIIFIVIWICGWIWFFKTLKEL